ncbi:MAG: glycosyl hydrolase [Luteolibacter sp.]|uniref:glycosyl hydrolase n=1 Tax=Luteolibacter sp. TaxID=1962973 RepID=UPI003264640C
MIAKALRSIFLRSSLALTIIATACGQTTLRIDPESRLQEFQGMGCGVIFYEGHVTSFAAREKPDLQSQLYDDMFKDVRTDFLQLMIRHDHEPENDNDDPMKPRFKPEWFAYAEQTVAICKAARERNPKIRFYATLYTPPPWMKTNNDPSGGGKDKATIKPGMELELAEYCWAFLAYMQRAGFPIEFLSIANEPDWPHDQPGYNLDPASHAKLIKQVAGYLDEMARRFPNVPLAKLVGPNTLNALSAGPWMREADSVSKNAIAVVGTHDYDRRGERFEALRKIAGTRPLWVTEWSVNGEDKSPDLINSAGNYWLAMTEAFNQGVNTWMAYDWVYPPREGGEALIHVDWGNSYHKTKIYEGFRQWCAPLAAGVWVVKSSLNGPGATGISQPGVKACAFLSADGKRLVAHVANVQDSDATFAIDPGPKFAAARLKRTRTSGTENMATLPVVAGGYPVSLPARSMNTWEWTLD